MLALVWVGVQWSGNILLSSDLAVYNETPAMKRIQEYSSAWGNVMALPGCQQLSPRIIETTDIVSILPFCGTNFCGRGSGLDSCLRELEDLITDGQVSAGVGAEVGGNWIRGKWKEVVEH